MRESIRILLMGFCLFACGPKGEFAKARASEKLGRYSSAIRQYENFWKLHSKDSKAPEALYRVGEIYKKVLGDYEKARRNYRSVKEWYPQSPWAAEAETALINCPDYFPFRNGKRVLGDSESGGANAKTVEALKWEEKEGKSLKVKRDILAGDYKVGTADMEYEKKEGELREKLSGKDAATVILKFPAEPGKKWQSVRNGKRVTFTIESIEERLKVKAGTFASCLKVHEREMGRPDISRVAYYAPDVGLILVSQASKTKETRLIELLTLEKK